MLIVTCILFSRTHSLECTLAQKLKTAYWVEQVHHKVKEYHRLEAERHPVSDKTAAYSLETNSTLFEDGASLHSARALMRQRETTAPHHAELGRTVRALRASAITQAKEQGTWHSNPAVGTKSIDTQERPKSHRKDDVMRVQH